MNTPDLSRYTPHIFDQGSEGSCFPNAIIGAIQLQNKEAGVTIPELSRQQYYNDIRTAQNTFNFDSGTAPSVGFDVAISHGIGYETSFSYGPQNMYLVPNAQVESEAASHKVFGIEKIVIEQTYTSILRDIQAYLIQGKPVLIGGINFTFSDGSQVNGGHELFIVGADTSTGLYKVQNSWSSNWGDHGYGYIRFDELSSHGSHQSPLVDISVITGFAGVDLTWTAERTTAASFYVATFARTAENGGVVYWGSMLHNGTNPVDVLNCFMGSSEFTAQYGANLTNTDFVKQEYLHILGRTADDSGLAYWKGLIDNGMSRGGNMSALINAVNSSTTDTAAHDFFYNRTLVSMNGAITYQDNGSHYQADLLALTGVSSDSNTIEPALIGLHTSLYG